MLNDRYNLNISGPRSFSDGEEHPDHEENYSGGRTGLSSSPSLSNGIHLSDEDNRNLSVDSFVEVAAYGPHWSAKRHLTCGNPAKNNIDIEQVSSWRMKDKLKTVNAALVVCLNIDVDPPDVVKPNPCAYLECWVDPRSMPSNKALESIGHNLQAQFEMLCPRIRYKPYLDPSHEDTMKFCSYLRKTAQNERCLFYYNGHGVPKPTPSGELWVFNKNYSQYIPVSLADIQNWLGSPCIYIWDCSAAGNLFNNYLHFAKARDTDMNKHHGGYPNGMQPFMESFQLAACLSHEQLPMNPDLPADLFTSCLTSPIDIALRWYCLTKQLPGEIALDVVQKIPGDLKDRRTPLGELNWIFTAVTDTIAWTTFSRETFITLYRSDLLVASLFRNFLLAERIMKNYHCTPHTYPPLPATNTHPMWASWDLAVDCCLTEIIFKKAGDTEKPSKEGDISSSVSKTETTTVTTQNRFFFDHLTAFQVWLARGNALTKHSPSSLAARYWLKPGNGSAINNVGYCADLVPRKPPDQLPIILQVLLSQHHRLRALTLLAQFVDLGPWAVHLALTIGIFPFIMKLLQAHSVELRPVLIFIWARILAVDPTCQTDLVTNQGYKYFTSILTGSSEDEALSVPNSSEHKAMCCFILSAICRGYRSGQNVCWHEGVFDVCFERLEEEDFLLRQWMALCIGQMWDGYDDIKIYGVDKGTQDKLVSMLTDNSPEVRSAALFALSIFMGASGSLDPSKTGGGGTGSMYHLNERTHFRLEVSVTMGATLTTKDDASPMVRKELLILLSCLVKEWRGNFVVAAWLYWEEEQFRLSRDHNWLQSPLDQAIDAYIETWSDDEEYCVEARLLLSSFYTLFAFILELTTDPYPEVAAYAQTVMDYIMALLLESPFKYVTGTSLNKQPPSQSRFQETEPRSRMTSLTQSTLPPAPLARSDSIASTGSASGSILRRTASFANSLRNIAGSYAFPSLTPDESDLITVQAASSKSRSDVDVSTPPSPNLQYAEYTAPYNHADDLKQPIPFPSYEPLPESGDQKALYEIYEVFSALFEEDMDRLRVRRKKENQERHYQEHSQEADDQRMQVRHARQRAQGLRVTLGVGTGSGLPEVLPLKSKFYDWCCEYFKETQMRQPESEEPGSVQYNEQMWRRQRNEKIVEETQEQAEIAPRSKWNRSIATVQQKGPVSRLIFHEYDSYIFAANETNTISVFDWVRRKRVSMFNNGNPIGSSISSLCCVNQDVGGLIMVGSSDGSLKLYRNYDPYNEPLQMVTSFRASPMVPMKRGRGLILDWQQGSGLILAGGDSRMVRMWDAHRECLLKDISTLSECPITSINSDYESALFLASFGDGKIKLFDRRLSPEDAIVKTYRGHTSAVNKVRWQRGAARDVLSAGLDGEVRLWDIRGGSQSIHNWIVHTDGLSAFDVHDQTTVFASSSALTSAHWRQQITVVQSFSEGEHSETTRIISPSGLHHPPTRESNVHTSLAFHPNEMIFGIGGADGSIRVMGCKFVDQATHSVPEGITELRNGHASSIYSDIL